MAKRLSEEEKAKRAEEKAIKEKEKLKVITESEVRDVIERNKDKGFGWFALQTHTGKEIAAKRSVEDRFSATGVSNDVGIVLMPEKVFSEIRNDKMKKVKRRLYPGYLFIYAKKKLKDDSVDEYTHQMDLKVYHSVIGALHIHGFASQDKEKLPRIISRLDVDALLNQLPKGDEVERTYNLEEGLAVKIVSGSYENFSGEVSEITDESEGKLKVKINLLGTETIVDVKYSEIEII